jgi:hypothetical protein
VDAEPWLLAVSPRASASGGVGVVVALYVGTAEIFTLTASAVTTTSALLLDPNHSVPGAVTFALDGTVFAVGMGNRSVRFVGYPSPNPVGTNIVFNSDINGLAYSPDGTEIVVAGGVDDRTGREEVQAHVLPDRERLQALARSQDVPFDDAFVERAIKREIDQRCQQLAPFKRVKRVFVRREEFPKTTTGKIRRRDLNHETERAGRSAVA